MGAGVSNHGFEFALGDLGTELISLGCASSLEAFSSSCGIVRIHGWYLEGQRHVGRAFKLFGRTLLPELCKRQEEP